MTDFPAYSSTTSPYLNPTNAPSAWRDGDTYGCDVCGKMTPVNQLISFVINCVMTGNNTNPMYQCHGIQHYACCMEHAVIANVLCAMEHMTIDGNYVGRPETWSNEYNILYAQLGQYVQGKRGATPAPIPVPAPSAPN